MVKWFLSAITEIGRKPPSGLWARLVAGLSFSRSFRVVLALFAYRDVECMVDTLQRAVPVPQLQVVVHRALRRRVFGRASVSWRKRALLQQL
jgi:hypothetical protein